MQANFIEALLDDRYYRTMPYLDYHFGFAILVALDYILMVYRNKWVSTILRVVGMFAFSVLLLQLSVRLLGWYLNPVPVGLTAIVVGLLGMLFPSAERAAEQ